MRNWLFILIFSTLLGNMNAHQVQLVTHHEKTNGVLIRVVVSNVPDVKDIAGWVGQENWFYLTLNEAVFAEGVLENLVNSSPILEIEGIQNKQSVQIGFLMENYISDFEIFHSPSNRVFLIHVWHELDGSNIADIRKSESENSNKIFSLSDQNLKGIPFYESFIDAREKYGPEKYFVWYDNWYSTEDKLDSVSNKKETDIWDKHWSGNSSSSKEEFAYGPRLPKDHSIVKPIQELVDSEEKENIYHHLGIYSYNKDTLEKFVSLNQSASEIKNKLEQLRALDNNMKINVAFAKFAPIGVDTEEDLEAVKKIMENKS